MVRTKRSAKLDTWNARKKLPVGKVNQEPLAPGHYLAYRRPPSGAAGTWFALWRHESKIIQTRLGTADDFASADGEGTLTYAQAQAKAQRVFQSFTNEARTAQDGVVRKRGPFTVADAINAYLERQEAKSERAAKDARSHAEKHILPALGRTEVERLSRLQIETWLNTLATSPRLKRLGKKASRLKQDQKANNETTPTAQISPEGKRARKATANRILTTLKAALNYARSRELVNCSDNAWKFVEPFENVSIARQSYLNPEEQQRFLNAIKDHDFWNLVYGALITGCRYGELCSMRVGEFDAQSQTILIPEAKNGQSRFIYLTNEGAEFFESITAGRGSHELIFTRKAFEDRRRLDAETRAPIEKVQRAWRPSEQRLFMSGACDAAGLPRMGFHQLRHSFASNLASQGVPLQIVAVLTGHKDSRMTERHYSHIAPSDVRRHLEANTPKFQRQFPSVGNLRIKKTGA